MSTDEREERAHGGIVSRAGDVVTMGDGNRWWLNGAQWARNEADAAIIHHRLAHQATRVNP